MSKAVTTLANLPNPDIGSVKMPRHVLDLEAKTCMWIVRRVGRRLRRQLIDTPEDQLPGGAATSETPADHEWLEYAKWYSSSLMQMLKEQRLRAALVDQGGMPQLTDEEYAEEMRLMVEREASQMSPEQLRDMLEKVEAK